MYSQASPRRGKCIGSHRRDRGRGRSAPQETGDTLDNVHSERDYKNRVRRRHSFEQDQVQVIREIRIIYKTKIEEETLTPQFKIKTRLS